MSILLSVFFFIKIKIKKKEEEKNFKKTKKKQHLSVISLYTNKLNPKKTNPLQL